MEGAADPLRIGEVRQAGEGLFPPVVVVDGVGAQVEPVTVYLRDLALSDMSRLTCRSYAFDLLRWFRFLWALDVAWERASSAEVAVMVGWMKTARNPQRATRSGKGRGAVNSRTGKALLGPGYAPRTVNHALSVTWNLSVRMIIFSSFDHGLERAVGRQGSAAREVASAGSARAGGGVVAGVGRSWACASDD
jgi:hypothetical protein